MIELNVNPVDGQGTPIHDAIITVGVMDSGGNAVPMEPAIRQQWNFYAGTNAYLRGSGPPYQVYGTAVAPGYGTSYFGPLAWDGATTLTISVTLSFKGPSHWTIDQLCAVRGAMWTARLDIPYGPRPNQPDNINALDYLEAFDAPTRQRMLASYRDQRYTHCVDGPMLDNGYHRQYPAVDFRQRPDEYFGYMVEKWRAGICPIHFAYPDDYGFDAGSFDQFVRDFEPIYRSANAQRLIKIWVPYGWERGYEVTSAMWVRMLTWAREVLPNALVAIHLRADQDAPTGGDDDHMPGWNNGKAWHAVAPYTHLWLVQNAGYTDGGSSVPTPIFVRNFTNQFNPFVRGSLAFRFQTGYAEWPTSSAFGPSQPIKVVAGEFASYADYWLNYPEIEAQKLGDAAIAAGAAGSLDGCFAAEI